MAQETLTRLLRSLAEVALPRAALAVAAHCAVAGAILMASGTLQSNSLQAAQCSSPLMECPAVRKLLSQREGYGRFATGGLNGEFAVVTSAADSGPGTLRELVTTATGPRWITFASDFTITLNSAIDVPPDVTIDGRGHNILLQDHGLKIVHGSNNVVVTHIAIDGRFKTEDVAVNIVAEAHDIWLDHLTLSRFIDRLINVKGGSSDVTLSWIRFQNHNKVMLLNNFPEEDSLFAYWDRDSDSRVTMHHCYFVDTVQRNPRAQIGIYHIYNNLLENWDYYGMSFSLEARALVEGNIFSNLSARPCREPEHFDTIEGVSARYCTSIAQAPARTALANGEADREEYFKGYPKYHYTHEYKAFLKVRDNLYLGDARPVLTDYKPENVPSPPYCTTYEKPTEQLAEVIRKQAGNLGTTPPHESICPDHVETTPRHHQVSWDWKNYSDKTASVTRPQHGSFVIRETQGVKGEHGIVQFYYGKPHVPWTIEVTYKPIGNRNLTIYVGDQKDEGAALMATCLPDGNVAVSKEQKLHETQGSVTTLPDGYYRCTVEGTPGLQPGNAMRFDLMTNDGRTRSPVGDADAGLYIREIKYGYK